MTIYIKIKRERERERERKEKEITIYILIIFQIRITIKYFRLYKNYFNNLFIYLLIFIFYINLNFTIYL